MSGLPQGWVDATLDDIAAVNPGRIEGLSADTSVSFVPMPAVSDVHGEIVSPTVRPFAEVSKGYTQFQEGDVIFAKITPCMENGKIAVARLLKNGMACGSTEFHVVRPLGENSPDYIWRFLRQKSYRDEAEASMTGAVGQRRVPAAHLKESRVPLPPLPEQRRIVAKIDSVTGKSRRARDHLDHIPRLVEKYKQAVLAAAFRGDLTRDWRDRTGISEPWIRARWSDAGSTLNGRAFPSGDYCNEGVRLLRPGNLDKSGSVSWNEKNTRHLPHRYASQHPEHFIQGQQIVINLTAQSLEDQFLGRVCLSSDDDEFILNQRIALFRPHNMTKQYCFYALKSPDFRAFVDDGLNSGSLIQHVHTKQLETYVFRIAPALEQIEIVFRIERAFNWIDRLTSEATSARKLIDHLDQSILAKAFRGELVPQDPNDEPAIVLLERIKAERGAAPKTKRRRKSAASVAAS